ncbi:hypothetical protein FKM82_016214 [Ascaphus truei]
MGILRYDMLYYIVVSGSHIVSPLLLHPCSYLCITHMDNRIQLTCISCVLLNPLSFCFLERVISILRRYLRTRCSLAVGIHWTSTFCVFCYVD